MQVIHLSGDVPDPLAPRKTRAITGLLDLVPEVEHVIYALNRVGARHGISVLPFDRMHRAVSYGAPPLGLLHKGRLMRLARWLLDDIRTRGLRPDAIHAHKLTIEGIAALPVAKALGMPLIVSCQGNTDLKIVAARPDLNPLWRTLWHGADWVLPFAPWTAEALADRLGPREGPMTCLPCPTGADGMLPPKPTGPVIRSVFDLGVHRNKGARKLIGAVGVAARTLPDIRLEIVGTGPPAAFAALSAEAAASPAAIRLTGPVPHGEIQALMNRTACMVLPSRRESYGMVFAEALLAGCPVIHGTGSGIAGYFPDAPFAQPIQPGGTQALAAQILALLRDQAEVKRHLALAQRDGTLDRLRRPAIRSAYRAALAGVVGRGTANAPVAKEPERTIGPGARSHLAEPVP